MPKAKRSTIISDKLYARVVNGSVMFPHAVSVEGKRLIVVSGQLAWDKNGAVVGKSDMRTQFRQVCENIKEALAAAGATWSDVIKTNTYVTNMDEFFECTDIRQEYFGPGNPTSTTIEVTRLAHPDMWIEIEAMAVIPDAPEPSP